VVGRTTSVALYIISIITTTNNNNIIINIIIIIKNGSSNPFQNDPFMGVGLACMVWVEIWQLREEEIE
jgi:hypothetical protein